MNFWNKYRVWIINIIVAVAIMLIVNFSDLLTMGQPQVHRKMPSHVVWAQMLYFFSLAYITLTVNTWRRGDMWLKVLYTFAIVTLFYSFMPTWNREGELIIQWNARRFFDGMAIMKSSFVAVVSILYGAIFQLLYQKQNIAIENQQLKNENLQTKYNMLANQISPHFLFNSLTSLSMLVRNRHNDKALLYIDKMSDTFRYMLQHGQNDMTTVEHELAFAEAYMYLHLIRYESKLFFEVDVDEKYLSWKMPGMSLQPLIENAVKHNAITASKPFKISVTTAGPNLVITNPVIPKLKHDDGTGIGLKNLSSRYILLTGREIRITHTDKEFSVTLPLIKV